MNKKNILTAAVSLSLVACLSIGATLAYFTDKTETAQNVFTTGNVNVTLIDQAFKDDENASCEYNPARNENGGYDYTHVMPGDKIGKNVAVEIADGSEDCYVAVSVRIENTNDPEALYTDMSDLYAQIIAVSADYGWLYDYTSNGAMVFYYPIALTNSSADNIAPLFSYLNIPTEWGNEYANSTLNITVQAAAVQAANLNAPAGIEDTREVNDSINSVVELNKLLFGE